MVRLSIVQTLQFGKDYRYAISINGKEEYQTGNSKAQEFENVKMYAGDEYYNPAGANIEKIKFQNIGMIFFLCFCFLFIFIYLLFNEKKFKYHKEINHLIGLDLLNLLPSRPRGSPFPGIFSVSGSVS